MPDPLLGEAIGWDEGREKVSTLLNVFTLVKGGQEVNAHAFLGVVNVRDGGRGVGKGGGGGGWKEGGTGH